MATAEQMIDTMYGPADESGASPTAGIESRVLPHDLDAEAAVLCLMMHDPEAPAEVSDFLRPEHFYADSHRRIFEACLDLVASGQPVDVVTVMGWLRDRGRLAQVGGPAYLTIVQNAAPALHRARAYGVRIEQLSRVRDGILAAQRIAADGYAGVESPNEFLEAAAAELHALAFSPTQSARLKRLTAPMEAVFRRIEEARAAGRTLLGLPTGLARYDRLTGGMQDGDLTIVAARPGKGKSALALGAAVHVARKAGPVAFFSLEMPEEQLAQRAACSAARVDLGRARIGELTAAEQRRLMDARAAFHELPVYVDDTARLTIAAMRARVKRAQRELERERGGEARFRLVVVDYLQLVHGSGRSQRDSREREVAEVAQGLKELAKDLRVHVMACCQMNRGIEDADRRPRLRDLRESGGIEQAADNVVFVHHPSGKDAIPNLVELCIEKQRNGPQDIVSVRFDGMYTRFDDLPDDYDIDPAAHAPGCRCGACSASARAPTYTCGACGRTWRVGTSCSCGATQSPAAESALTEGLGL